MRKVLLLAFALVFASVSAMAQNVQKTDVLVIGAGGAGLSSAVSAAEQGASVIVIEKLFTIGGSTMFSGGVLNAPDPKRQEPKGIKDSPELFAKDIMEAGDNIADKDVVMALASNATSTLYWLEDLGLKVKDEIYSKGAGNSVERSHETEPFTSGRDYLDVLKKAADKHGVKFVTSMKATELLQDKNGRVTQVKAVDNKGKETIYEAKAVILATGGFGANVEMRMQYDPRLTSAFGTTNNPSGKAQVGNTGDGIVMAQKIGAATTGMEYIQLLALNSGRSVVYAGADIFITKDGKRFVDENGRRDVVANAMIAAPDSFCWVITDSQSRKAATFESRLKSGMIKEAQSVEEMAKGMGIDPKVLQQTLDTYNKYAKEGKDPEFGRTIFTQQIDKAPYYYGKMQQEVHYTMGGLVISPKAEVKDSKGKVISGLYAAGEVTGGVHGTNRVGGNGVLDIMVFGRIAGQNAAELAKKTK